MASKRPIRKIIESGTENIPRGPLGFFGEGNALGAAGFLAVELVNTFIPGSSFDAGFDVESHNIKRGDEVDTHIFIINAISRDVAESVSKFLSTPSNIDFFRTETKVVDTQLIKERSTFSTWKITVEASSITSGEIK